MEEEWVLAMEIVNGVWVLLYFKLKIKKSNIYENHAIECY